MKIMEVRDRELSRIQTHLSIVCYCISELQLQSKCSSELKY